MTPDAKHKSSYISDINQIDILQILVDLVEGSLNAIPFDLVDVVDLATLLKHVTLEVCAKGVTRHPVLNDMPAFDQTLLHSKRHVAAGVIEASQLACTAIEVRIEMQESNVLFSVDIDDAVECPVRD